MSRTHKVWATIVAFLALVLSVSVVPVSAQAPSSANMPIADFVRLIYTNVTNVWSTQFANTPSWPIYTAPAWYTLEAGLKTESLCPGAGVNNHTWLGDPNDESGLNPAFYCPMGGGFLNGVTLTTPVIYLSTPWLSRLGVMVDPDNHDFAIASIVAHELAHDVQTQLAYISTSNGQIIFNYGLDSKQIELSADCLSGVWAYTAYYAGLLTDTDVEEAQAAAFILGTDVPLPVGTVNDHGTGADRLNYWSTGYNTGDPSLCNPTIIAP